MDSYYYQFQQLKIFLINTGKNYNVELVEEAYERASQMHEGQYRKSGEEYISHPIAVAQVCANLGYDTESICAALLHDVVEDCPEKISLDDIAKEFGTGVCTLVDGLTKLTGMRFDTKEEESIQNLRKMFFAMSKDPRVMFIKLCDRLHNMRTISSMPEAKQKSIALETMHVFAPVAHRLGIQKIKAELEDLSLKVLDPIGYEQIREDIDKKYGEARDVIEKSQDRIKQKLNESGIKYTVEGRAKTVNSLYRKIFMNGKLFDEIYDFYAIRFIVNNLTEVYHVLGIVHDLYKYLPDRFKDYISTPKQNNYQSVHTTVINETGIPFEVQIRTREMHETAEFGVAAHWKYKSGDEAPEEITKKMQWLKTLIEIENNSSESEEFISFLKIGLYTDEIFVYTPKGDVKSLPKGSTIIDFAYAIHSAVGNKTIGAKVNGIITPIDTELENNQIVEILTSNSSKGPNRNWLKFVKTGEAKNKIRQWFKKENRAENILIGRDEIDRVFKQFNRPFTEIQKTEILTNIAKREGFAILEDFYNAIGYGGFSINKIAPKIKDEIARITEEKSDDLILDISQIELEKEKVYSDTTDIIIDGLDNCQIKLAKCCNPLPGDEIKAFMTKGGHGLSVHKTDCQNFIILTEQPEAEGRVFTAIWNKNKTLPSEKASKDFKSMLRISAVNDVRLFSALSTELADMKIAIHSITEVKTKTDGSIILNILISTRDLEHLNYIISRLKNIKNVKEADRS